MTPKEDEAGTERMYGPTKPCPQGHLSLRFKANHSCVECARIHSRRAYYQNREDRARRNREWHQKNIEAHRKRASNWAKRNPEKVQAINANNKAKRRSQPGKLTPREWEAVLEKFGRKCLCCGSTERLTADHVIPLARGGTNTADNIQPLCMRCNQSKGARRHTDYRGGQHVAM